MIKDDHNHVPFNPIAQEKIMSLLGMNEPDDELQAEFDRLLELSGYYAAAFQQYGYVSVRFTKERPGYWGEATFELATGCLQNVFVRDPEVIREAFCRWKKAAHQNFINHARQCQTEACAIVSVMRLWNMKDTGCPEYRKLKAMAGVKC